MTPQKDQQQDQDRKKKKYNVIRNKARESAELK